MKKVWAILLTLVLLMGCALAENTNLVGKWSVSHAEYNGVTVDGSQLGVSFDVDIKTDGKVAIVMDDTEAVGTWQVENGVLKLDNGAGNVIAFTLSGDGFYMEENGAKIHFAKEAGQEVTEPAASDFDPVGVWKLIEVSYQDQVRDLESIGMSEVFFNLFADGTLDMETNGESQKGTWTLNNNVFVIDDGSIALECPIVGDTFTANVNGMTMTFARTGAAQPAAPEAPVQEEHADEFDPLGTWKFTSAEAKGVEVDMALINVTMTFDIHSDSTLDYNIDGTQGKGAWIYNNGYLMLNDGISTTTFTVEGDTFYVVENDVKMIFTREAGFNAVGEWQLTVAEKDGETFDVAAMGQKMTFTFEADGVMLANVNGVEGKGTWELAGDTLTLDDGVSTMSLQVEEDSFYLMQSGVKLIFTPVAEK